MSSTQANKLNLKFAQLKTIIKDIEPKRIVLYSLLLSILTCVVYLKLFSSGFISWDDGEVILNNKDVHDFNLKAFFTRHYVGNYAPLTMITFAFDWLIFKGNATGHHAMSLLFHIINSVLVYFLARLILKNELRSVICAIIFCFHPLQVETVAWASAKNNLVYSFFFLAGLICYVKFILENTKKYYSYSLLFFVLAVLSKPSAICFPLVLFLIDYLLKSKLSFRQLFLNKIPFILIAVIFGITTLYTRTEDNFLNQNHAFAFYERLGYAGYAVLLYLYKFLLPVNLSVIYPYPSNQFLSLIMGYIFIALFVYWCFKLYRSKNKLLLFGSLFFIVNLILVLQFIPFGEVLTADRYMYLPIAGIAFILVTVIPFMESYLKTGLALLIVVYGILTFKRVGTWKNSITLYTDILEKYPHSPVALSSLGAEYMLNKNYSMATRYLNAAVRENKDDYRTFYNRGLLYAQTGEIKTALEDFNKAIALKKYPKAYVARANVYYELNDFQKAMSDAEFVLKTDPDNIGANYILANCYSGLNRLPEAIYYYDKCIALKKNEHSFYFKRAITLGKQQKFNECLKDLETATGLKPDFAEAYYWKGVAKVNLKQNPCYDFNKAFQLGFTTAEGAFSKYCR